MGYACALFRRGRLPHLRRIAADLKHVWVFAAFGCGLAPTLFLTRRILGNALRAQHADTLLRRRLAGADAHSGSRKSGSGTGGTGSSDA